VNTILSPQTQKAAENTNKTLKAAEKQ